MTDLTDVLGGRFPLPRETPEEDSSLLRDRKGRIRTKDPARDRTLKLFLAAFLVIGIAAMLLMKIDWLQFCEGLVRIPEALGKLIQIDFSQIDITFSSLLESIGVAVLSTVYSMVGGLILAVFLAKNLTPFKGVATVLSAALTGSDWQVGKAELTIRLSETEYDCCLPVSALHSDNGGDFVYSVEERNTILGLQNIVRKVYVEVVERNNELAALRNYTTGAPVVAATTKSLQEGARVRTAG